MKTTDLDLSIFQPVICNRLKANGHRCNRFLGFLDKSRPNKSIHFCPEQKINHVHTVDENGLVSLDTIEGEIILPDVPVEVAPIHVYDGN